MLSITCGHGIAHAENTNVFYSGFAFLGEHEDIESQYKYSNAIYKLKDANNRPLVEAKLSAILQTTNTPGLNIVSSRMGDLNEGDGLSMAVALDWEDVAVEQIEEGLVKSVYNLHGQIIFFDFKKMAVVACYPFGVRATDSTAKFPSEARRLEIFEKLYLSEVGGINFLQSFCDLFKDVHLKANCSSLNLKVEDVQFESKAQAFFKKQYPDQREQAIKTFTAQQFSSFFSKNVKASILPYTKGSAIGNKMAGRFANGDVFELSVPDGDYSISIIIRGFKKVMLDENATGQSWAYGSYIRLVVESPFGDIVNTKIKNGSTKIVPVGQSSVADKSAYTESLLVLFDRATRQLADPDSDWFDDCAEGKATKKQFAKLTNKINTF